jgi:pyridoxal phosphate enzyme (YggS family)
VTVPPNTPDPPNPPDRANTPDPPGSPGTPGQPRPSTLPSPAGLADVALVAERLASVQARIVDAGGSAGGVEIVAVTKGFPPEIIGVATGAGLQLLGENYAQELVAKATWAAAEPGRAAVGDGAVRWQFIGQLQRNKVRQLAPHVHRWQSVDRPELVDEIARRAPAARLLVQVNTTGEPQKAGCEPGDAAGLVSRARDAGLRVEGLMTVGPTDAGAGSAATGRAFRLLRRLVDDLDLDICSMGMTDDLEAAVAEGSTMVRVGRALFGPRPVRGRVGH